MKASSDVAASLPTEVDREELKPNTTFRGGFPRKWGPPKAANYIVRPGTCPHEERIFSHKRAMDIFCAVILIVLFLPLMLILAVLIKADSPGPVIFRQQRVGINKKVIIVLKFRSMKHQPKPQADVSQARRGDPRLTRVGRTLRRTSLDELPQLFNVLRGDMSLVGPRPHALAHDEYYAAHVNNYYERCKMLPGITGLAQINGMRGGTDTLDKMERRVAYDLTYIEHWSIWLDIKILFLTPFKILRDHNAY